MTRRRVATGSPRSSTWSINVKIAVFAPMPSASVRTTMTAKAEFLRRARDACRMSRQIVLISDSLDFFRCPGGPV